MLFSFVILALPVGVIAGTFGSVWDANEQEKKAQGAHLKTEVEFVAYEIARLDPRGLLNLLLIEVWDDRHGVPICDGSEPQKASFMGEAKVFLDLKADECNSQQLTLPLEANYAVKKRGVSGNITIRYEWIPESCAEEEKNNINLAEHEEKPYQAQQISAMEKLSSTLTSSRSSKAMGITRGPSLFSPHLLRQDSKDLEVKGTLRVAILSASGLINLDTGQLQGTSSPYCTVLCYPRLQARQGLPTACVWCTPTALRTLSPQWHISHSFSYDWRIPARGEKLEKRFESEAKDDNKKLLMVSEGSVLAEAPYNLYTSEIDLAAGVKPRLHPQVGEVIGLVREMAADLQDQRAAVRRVQEEMQTLTARVDKVSQRFAQGATRWEHD